MTDDPKWYLHEPFMLGANVPDGREGRRVGDGEWLTAPECRGYLGLIFETRPVPERMAERARRVGDLPERGRRHRVPRAHEPGGRLPLTPIPLGRFDPASHSRSRPGPARGAVAGRIEVADRRPAPQVPPCSPGRRRVPEPRPPHPRQQAVPHPTDSTPGERGTNERKRYMETHTIDEALERFQLIGNSGGSPEKNTACVMTALSWVAGESWTDHPRCAHPVLANLAIRANDHHDTTEAERADIVRAGATGLIDTWWLPGEVVVWCIAEGMKATDAPVGRCLATLAAVTGWKATKERPDLAGANLAGAYLAGEWSAYLAGANLTGANLAGANLSGADLRGANLAGANLAHANLTGANLAGANLAHANLARARCNRFTVPPAGWTVNTTTWRMEKVA